VNPVGRPREHVENQALKRVGITWSKVVLVTDKAERVV
jgi:hypothetical protein